MGNVSYSAHISNGIGISSMLLPSFFSVIKEKDILLLTHPILEREIERFELCRLSMGKMGFTYTFKCV